MEQERLDSTGEAGFPQAVIHPEVRKAGEVYERARDEWLSKSGPVKEAKAALIAAMREAGISEYREDDLRIVLKPGKDSVKLTRGEEEGDE